MGWNEPDKQKDPWGNKNQPPDLEELIKRFIASVKALFGGNSNKTTAGRTVPSGNKSGGVLVAGVGIIALILWFLSGIFIVDPAEQAAILYFGKYRETVGSGPHWIPRFVAS